MCKGGIHAKDNQKRGRGNSSIASALEIWDKDAERSILSTSEEARTTVKVSQSLRSERQSVVYEDKYGTHLTVNWPGSVKTDHVRDHRQKGSHASKGVQLQDKN